jgi:hypothetical protein
VRGGQGRQDGSVRFPDRRTGPLGFSSERWSDLPVQKEIEAQMEIPMPRGDNSSYTDKQKRMAEHIEEGYKKRAVSENEAERRAWATVIRKLTAGRRAAPAEVSPKTTLPLEWAPRRRSFSPQARRRAFRVRKEGRSRS